MHACINTYERDRLFQEPFRSELAPHDKLKVTSCGYAPQFLHGSSVPWRVLAGATCLSLHV